MKMNKLMIVEISFTFVWFCYYLAVVTCPYQLVISQNPTMKIWHMVAAVLVVNHLILWIEEKMISQVRKGEKDDNL